MAVEKYSVFSILGARAVQPGRQKIPVVFTPTMKMPSKEVSLFTKAWCMVFLSGSFEVFTRAPWVEFWGSIREAGIWDFRKMDMVVDFIPA